MIYDEISKSQYWFEPVKSRGNRPSALFRMGCRTSFMVKTAFFRNTIKSKCSAMVGGQQVLPADELPAPWRYCRAGRADHQSLARFGAFKYRETAHFFVLGIIWIIVSSTEWFNSLYRSVGKHAWAHSKDSSSWSWPKHRRTSITVVKETDSQL